MSPIAPFFAEWLYKNLTDGDRAASVAHNTDYKFDSVHLTYWPKIETEVVDLNLEESMELAQTISSLVHSIRKTHKLKVRQPLSKILIPVLNDKTKQQIEQVKSIILTEVNVKTVEFVHDDSGILKKKIKPNFKTLGPKFGPQMKAVAAAISAMSEAEIKDIEENGTISLVTAASPIDIAIADVEIIAEDVPGWLVASEGGLTVALDITVSDELRLEGIARDFVNRVQNLRKDSGFEVTDKIRITLQNNDTLLANAVTANKDYICQEVQALDLRLVGDLNGEAKEIEMDEFLLRVKIEVVI
jgi:isoleucyl-tRNA synthetase